MLSFLTGGLSPNNLAMLWILGAGFLPSLFALLLALYAYSFGECEPKAIPAGIAQKLNKEINAALADSKARLTDVGGDLLALSADDFAKLIAYEAEKWAKVMKFANIQRE